MSSRDETKMPAGKMAETEGRRKQVEGMPHGEMDEPEADAEQEPPPKKKAGGSKGGGR